MSTLARMLRPVRSRSRTTKWNLCFQYVSIAFPLISGIVLVPMYLTFIPIRVYGAWLATGNVIAWLAIVDPGLSTVLVQNVSAAYAQGRRDDLSGLLSNGIILSGCFAGLALAAGFIGLFASRSLLHPLQASEQSAVAGAFAVAVVGTALMIFSYSITAINLGLQSSLAVGLMSSVVTLASYGVTIGLLYAGFGVASIPAGLVVRGSGLIVGNVIYLWWRAKEEGLEVRWSITGFKKLSSLMSYVFFGRTAEIVAGNLDGLIVMRFLGPEVVPVLTLTRKAPELSRTVLERPAYAFMPAVAGLFTTGNRERTAEVLSRLLRFTIWALGLTCAGFVLLNGSFVRLWVGSKFYAGDTVSVLIVVGFALQIGVGVIASAAFALGNIKGNSVARCAQGVLTIPLLIVGARYFGLVGVAAVPILTTLAVAAPYYPRVFGKLLKLRWWEVSGLIREVGSAGVATVLVLIVMRSVPVTGWVRFSEILALVSLLYVLSLGLASHPFRLELARFSSRLWRRVRPMKRPVGS